MQEDIMRQITIVNRRQPEISCFAEPKPENSLVWLYPATWIQRC